MEMINIIGHMSDIDEISKKIILSSSIHMVNSMSEIEQSHFPILQAKDDVGALVDFNYIKQYASEKNLGEIEKKIEALLEIFGVRKKLNRTYLKEDYDFKNDIKDIEWLFSIVKDTHTRLNELKEEEIQITESEKYLSYLKDLDIDLDNIFSMKYIHVKLGKITKYNMDKLKKNYENIPAVVLKLFNDNDTVVVMILVPLNVEIEVDRVLKSLNFDEFKPNIKLKGTPVQCIEKLKIRKRQIKSEMDYLKAKLLDLKSENLDKIERYYSRLVMEYKIEELKSYMAVTKEFFYMTGWVPRYKKKALSESFKTFDERIIVIYKEISEIREGISPPTCLRNGYLLRPFESVVKMYGIPSYGEIDPTSFVGISYMLLFGAMFGDVGQGLVLFLLGELLSKKKSRPNLGGVVARLGLSSTFFGFIYGSIFGFEDILKTYIVRPMVSINLMLISAIALGTIFLTIGFIYNLVNSYKNRDIENGIFSRNGLSGLVFYWTLIYLVLAKVKGWTTIIPVGGLVLILLFLLGLMLFKEPITNIIRGVRPLYNETKTDYYIEGGFGVLETLLSMFSNTVSFIRVGAFAINHVGLFIAFETLSEMMTSSVGSALVLVIGNIIIIGLEGLIVFIQGLRLEYYELFSKYFSGIGYDYEPLKL